MEFNTIKNQLFDYLRDEAGIEKEIEVDDSLVEGGIIDSFDIVALSTWISQTYQIKINALEVNLDNFDSVSKMVSFIAKKAA